MPIETGTTLAELDDQWPLSGDPILEGDNHLRLIKEILKAQFPGEAGEGFAKVITATEDEINYLSGVTSSIQDQIDAITTRTDDMFPIGHQLITTNTANPSTYGYPGTWVETAAGALVMSASSGDAQLGTIIGDNDASMPVPVHNHTQAAHAHSMTHDHPAGTTSSNTHDHTVTITYKVSGTGSKEGLDRSTNINLTTTSTTLATVNSVTHSHTFDVPNYSGNTGSATPTINNAGSTVKQGDVRGETKKVIVWERTA